MDKIRKVIQFVEVDENNLSNNEGKVYVFFEDESIAPVELSTEDAYKAYHSMATEDGLVIGKEDMDKLKSVVATAAANGNLDLCNSLDPIELEAANAEFEAAKKKAEELGKGKGGTGGVVIPPVDPTDEEDYSNELEDEVEAKKHTGAKIAAAVLAGAALGGALYGGIEYLINHTQNNQDLDLDQDKTVDFDNGTFDELMDSMSDDDQRKVTSEKAMALVDAFHEATHKDGNFRVVEDGETYLDLSFEEALVLTTFANYSEPAELYEVLGSYDMTAEQAQDTLESARTKLITYYMNAVEPSGLADIFENEQDKQFFINMESSVVNFNAMHTTETSDQVIRNVYYNYILDGSTNTANLSPMARLLAFDAVYGGLNLTESASVDHTQFLEFKGMGAEEETKYYITNVLGLDYDSLSEDEIAKYRENIIEAGTDLVSVLSTGEVMTEENSTEAERAANVSLTNLVDKMGICNSVNAEINQKMEALDTMAANKAEAAQIHITNVNSQISVGLREAGLDDLAAQVEANLTEELNADLIKAIRASGSTGVDLAENYESRIAGITDANRPSIEQIINAANRDLAKKANYAGESKDVSTLINNRRHGVENHLTEGSELTQAEKDKGIVGKDENGVPIFDQDVIDEAFKDLTEEEKDQFIIENGTVIEETVHEDTKVEEEVEYEDLTEEEKVVVDQEKIDIFTKDTLANIYGSGQIAANEYENASNYVFANGTVVNPVTGTEYNLNDMNFASGVARAQAFANTRLNAETGIIERTGDFNIDADQDSQILNAAEVAAESYLSGLSAEEQNAIATGMGMTWTEAREQLKASYKDGYLDRMQTAIDLAIQEGNEQFETTKKAQEDAIAKSKEAEENAYLNEGVSANVSEDEVVVEEVVEPVVPAPAPVVEEDKSVTTDTVTGTGTVEGGTEANVDEEEFDWGAISTGDEEVVIVEATHTPATTGAGEDMDLEAAIQAAYEEALQRDALAAEESASLGGRSR